MSKEKTPPEELLSGMLREVFYSGMEHGKTMALVTTMESIQEGKLCGFTDAEIVEGILYTSQVQTAKSPEYLKIGKELREKGILTFERTDKKRKH